MRRFRIGGALGGLSLGERVRVGGAARPPPPVAAALASSLRAPSRGDPPLDGPSAMHTCQPPGRRGRKRWPWADPYIRAAGFARGGRKAAWRLERSQLAKRQPQRKT